jgi:hypothetical protein
MPAATRRMPRPDYPVVARHPRARPERRAIRDFRRPVHPSTHCALLALRRPGSNLTRSGLTFRQPLGDSLAMFDGPCDFGIPSAARTVGRRFPRSHGPAEGNVTDLGLRLPYRFTERPRPSIFSLPPDAWRTPLRCSDAPRPKARPSPRPIESAATDWWSIEPPRPEAQCVVLRDRIGRNRPAVRGTATTEAAMRRAARSTGRRRSRSAGPIRGEGPPCKGCPQNSRHVGQLARHGRTVALMSLSKRAGL